MELRLYFQESADDEVSIYHRHVVPRDECSNALEQVSNMLLSHVVWSRTFTIDVRLHCEPFSMAGYYCPAAIV